MTGQDPDQCCSCTDTQMGEPCQREVSTEDARCEHHSPDEPQGRSGLVAITTADDGLRPEALQIAIATMITQLW